MQSMRGPGAAAVESGAMSQLADADDVVAASGPEDQLKQPLVAGAGDRHAGLDDQERQYDALPSGAKTTGDRP